MERPSTRLLVLAMIVLMVIMTSGTPPGASAAVLEEGRSREDVSLRHKREGKDEDELSQTESLLINLLNKITDIGEDIKNITMTYTRFSQQALHLQDKVENCSLQQPQTTKIPSIPECPENYEEVGGECFRFSFTKKKNWNDAREDCHRDGGELAAKFDPEIMSRRLRGEPTFAVFVGATNKYSYGNWYWLKSGADVDPHFFAPGSPDDEDCGALGRQQNFRLVDKPCRTALAYVCQILPDDIWKNE